MLNLFICILAIIGVFLIIANLFCALNYKNNSIWLLNLLVGIGCSIVTYNLFGLLK